MYDLIGALLQNNSVELLRYSASMSSVGHSFFIGLGVYNYTRSCLSNNRGNLRWATCMYTSILTTELLMLATTVFTIFDPQAMFRLLSSFLYPDMIVPAFNAINIMPPLLMTMVDSALSIYEANNIGHVNVDRSV
jgi:hypothetical protein